MGFHIGPVTVEVVEGDITTFEVDAIVNAANNHLWMGGGVAGAIKRAGGARIEAEAMEQGPVEVGVAVTTSAGRLAASWVIHAAVMGQDLATNRDAIRAATISSLRASERLGISSIAFPAFGTGVGGFPPAQSAAAMVDAVMTIVRDEPPARLRRIVFVAFSPGIRAAFRDELEARASGGGQRFHNEGDCA